MTHQLQLHLNGLKVFLSLLFSATLYVKCDFQANDSYWGDFWDTDAYEQVLFIQNLQIHKKKLLYAGLF